MLSKLFTLCITEKKIFPPMPSFILPETVKKTVGRLDDMDKLKNALRIPSKIILSGEAGIGKTRFIKCFLYASKISDFWYSSYSSDLTATLNAIKYLDDDYNQCKSTDSKNAINEQHSPRSLLVIDHMYNYNKEELEFLSKLDISVIAITRSKMEYNGFTNIDLLPLPDEDLIRLFQDASNTSGDEKSMRSFYDKLLKTSKRNTLAVSLLGYCCKKASPVVNIPSWEKILDDFSASHLHKNTKNTFPKFKHPYDRADLDIIGHIKKIYMRYLPTEHLQTLMTCLSCFGDNPLPMSFVRQVVPEYNKNDIQTLDDMGLLSCIEDYLQLPYIVFHSVILTPMPRSQEAIVNSSMRKLFINITHFLATFDIGLSVPYLSNSLYDLMLIAEKRIALTHNPNQRTVSENYEEWNDLLYLIYNYYNQMGDFYLADKIAASIKYPALISRHSSWDSYILWIGNNMQSLDLLNEMTDYIDQVYDHISQYADTFCTISIHMMLINALDLIIELYFVLFFDNYFTNKYTDYMKTLSFVMRNLLKYIIEPYNDYSSPYSQVHFSINSILFDTC